MSWITEGGVTTAVGIMGIDMEFKGLHGLLVKARELERSGLTTFIYTGAFPVPSPYLTQSVRADIVLIDKVLGVKVAIAEDTYPNLFAPRPRPAAGRAQAGGRHERQGRRHALSHGRKPLAGSGRSSISSTTSASPSARSCPRT